MKRKRTRSRDDLEADGRDEKVRVDGARVPANRLVLLFAVIAGIAAAVVILGRQSNRTSPERYVARPPGTVTFTRDIAPIVFGHCANCHRPSQSGPFGLLTYAEVRKHARLIAEVTQSGYMPPWPPEPGHGEFVGERRLSIEQIGLVQQWVAEGAIEGSPADLPPRPQFPEGWQLGEPDLVVRAPQPYILPATGRDVYRNLVIPIPTTARRYVNAMELRPGNRSVHHAFILFDRTRKSRRADEQDAEPGFGGMNRPPTAEGPPGQFVSWQPGKAPAKGSDDSIWTLEPGTDLVLQLHLQPTGKPEAIQPAVALYFTNTAPTRSLHKIDLSTYDIDIPAGATDYSVSDSYVLPVDVEVLGLLPHAHYLGKELQSFATLPNGTKQWLLHIKHWDFKWQGDYRFVRPVALPAGSTLTMRWTYDNSTNNARNPRQPPTRVVYGVESTDEMAELHVQVRLRGPDDLAVMEKGAQSRLVKRLIEFNTYWLRSHPNDAKAHHHLGEGLFYSGRIAEASRHFRTAITLDPNFDEPHYTLGLLLRTQNQLAAARQEFETVLRLDPESSKAHGNLGFIAVEEGDLDRAEQHFRAALKLNPQDTLVRDSLAEVLKARNDAAR